MSTKTIIIALDAGHGLYTSGKRTADSKYREWQLNDVVCKYIVQYLKNYDCEIKRIDDTTGKIDKPLIDRTNMINKLKPDVSISIHHNANTGTWNSATGVEVFYSGLKNIIKDIELAKKLADSISKSTGLKNRGAKSDKLAGQGSLHMVREVDKLIPAVLCEGGFMDSRNDYVIITSAKGQQKYAKAVADVLISFLGLKKSSSSNTSSSSSPSNNSSITKLTPISGKSIVTAEQMWEYLKNKNPNAPNYTSLYITEGNAEGIRGDIAFAQSCLETGNWKFGGDIIASQNNFCGLGATGNGVKGNVFTTPQIGIRAQIQHLKAYANKEPLKQTCVDPRFQYVTRGNAEYVEWLGIQENPNKTGWASGKDYGKKILEILNDIINIKATTTPLPVKSKEEILIDNLVSVGVITDKAYWLGVLNKEHGITMTKLNELLNKAYDKSKK